MEEKMTLDTYYPGVNVKILEPDGKITRDVVANVGSKNIVLKSGRRFGTDVWCKDCFLEKKKAKPGKLFLTLRDVERYAQRRKMGLELKMIIQENWSCIQDFSPHELRALIDIMKASLEHLENEKNRGGIK